MTVKGITIVGLSAIVLGLGILSSSCRTEPTDIEEEGQEEVKEEKEEEEKEDSGFTDLGLSVKWATFNLGATNADKYGLYYQWGDTKGYERLFRAGKYFNLKNKDGKSFYKWYDATKNVLSKYNTKDVDGTVDGKLQIEADDDAAVAALGGTWRIPTAAEWEELLDPSNCTWTWGNDGRCSGFYVKSKKNGNSIFLPLPGYRENDDPVVGLEEFGYYWSSTLVPEDSWCVKSMIISKDWYGMEADYRYYGQSIRPVCK